VFPNHHIIPSPECPLQLLGANPCNVESPTLQARKQQMDNVENCGLAGIFHRAVLVI